MDYVFPKYLLTPADDIICLKEHESNTAIYEHFDHTKVMVDSLKIKNGLFRPFTRR